MGLFDKIKKKSAAEESPTGGRVVDQTGPRRKVMVIGLDCAPPEHVFDEYAGDIPNLTKLRENGVFGPLESIVPP
ncbi:MAG TPA: hypothetical protein VFK89_05640, partial [Actinomycetota bacterium]|nr:hypothetical protein [Actinomycetota bacterium]